MSRFLHRVEGWVTAVNGDPECRHIGQFSRFSVEVVCSGWSLRVHFSEGILVIVESEQALPAGDVIQLQGGASAWRDLADGNAPPRRHDLLALLKAVDGIDVISGRNELIRHLRVLTRLVEIGKSCGA